jgi:hypothetical protein
MRDAWYIDDPWRFPIWQMTKIPEAPKMKMLPDEEFAKLIASPF